jgi:hypothetical protein
MSVKLEELYVEIKTKTDSFEKDLSEIKSKLGTIGSSVDSVSEKTSRWGNIATGINQTFQTFKDTFVQLKNLIGDSVKAAADLDVLRSNFQGSTQDIELFRKATSNTLSEASLIKLSNQATDLGLSLEQQAIFFTLSKEASEKYGISTEEGFNKIIRATETSIKGLSKLGIEQARYNEILKDFEREQGRKLSDMDAEEQKQLKIQAVLIASGITLDDVKNKEMSNADAMESLSRATEEAKIKMGNLVVQALKPLLKSLKDNDSGFRTFVGTISAVGSTVINLIPMILQLAQLKKLSDIKTAATAVSGVETAMSGIGVAASAAEAPITGFFTTLRTGLMSIGGVASVFLAVVAGIMLLTKNINENVKAIKQHRKDVDDAYPNWDKSGFGVKNQADITDRKKSTPEGTVNLGNYLEFQKDKKILGNTSDTEKQKILVSDIEAKINKIKDAQKNMEVGSKELAKSWAEIERLQKQIDEPKKLTDEEIKHRKELAEQYKQETKIFLTEYEKRKDDALYAYNQDLEKYKDLEKQKIITHDEMLKIEKDRQLQYNNEIKKIDEDRIKQETELKIKEIDDQESLDLMLLKGKDATELQLLETQKKYANERIQAKKDELESIKNLYKVSDFDDIIKNYTTLELPNKYTNNTMTDEEKNSLKKTYLDLIPILKSINLDIAKEMANLTLISKNEDDIRKSNLDKYYESVKYADKDYYDYKIKQMEEYLAKADNLDEKEKALYRKVETEKIKKEKDDEMLKKWKSDNPFGAEMMKVALGGIDVISDAWSNFATTMIMTNTKIGDALKSLWSNIASYIISEISRVLVKMALIEGIKAIFSGATGGFGGAVISALGGHDGGTFYNGQKIAAYATGGSFIVPDGYPNDSYPLRVESGEKVTVTPSGAVGQQEKLLGELIGSVRALNKNFMMKNMSVNIEANVDGLTFVRRTTKPAENILIKNGYKLENL